MKFLSRELSWLSFNERVLQEAADQSVPLMERIKFLGIFSSNLDEFFRVRVATLRRTLTIGKKGKKIFGESPKSILSKIYQTVLLQQEHFEEIYEQILTELEKENIYLVNEKELSDTQKKSVKEYFRHDVRAYLVPIMIDDNKEFPYLKDRAIYLSLILKDSKKKEKPKYALIEIPKDVPRFLVLPEENGKKYVMFLDDVIRYCLNDIFYIFSYDTYESYTIKMTRDAELDIDDDLKDSFFEKISKGVKQRSYGKPVRLNYDETINQDLLTYIVKRIKVHDKKDNLIPGGRYHNAKDFIKFPMLGLKYLTNPEIEELSHPDFVNNTSMLSAMSKQDVLLHYPYHSFDHFIDLLREAAIDPKVESIKITLYRLAPRSKVGNALINAVNNGKLVTVVMELQARFDEEHNIYWSDKLREEGAKVILGVQGLKVHTKLCLITRKENGKKVHYANISTGNYNENTSRIYADHSLFTADPRITNDANDLFNFLENTYKVAPFKNIMIAPFHMRKKFENLIDNEIEQARKGKKAVMWFKLNNMADVDMAQKIAEAANAGVMVRLVIRSTCSLMPDHLKGHANIQIISIVDKFLEHSRIMIFHNGGEEKFYISSADWMYRNLNIRVEMACPIYDTRLQEELKQYFEMQLNDNVKARMLNDKQENIYRPRNNEVPFRAQVEIYKYLANKQS